MQNASVKTSNQINYFFSCKNLQHLKTMKCNVIPDRAASVSCLETIFSDNLQPIRGQESFHLTNEKQ